MCIRRKKPNADFLSFFFFYRTWFSIKRTTAEKTATNPPQCVCVYRITLLFKWINFRSKSAGKVSSGRYNMVSNIRARPPSFYISVRPRVQQVCVKKSTHTHARASASTHKYARTRINIFGAVKRRVPGRP
jgi:hypothetical protein